MSKTKMILTPTTLAVGLVECIALIATPQTITTLALCILTSVLIVKDIYIYVQNRKARNAS